MDLQNGDLRLSGEVRSSFKNFFLAGVNEDLANFVCLVGPAVKKKNTNFRNAIGMKERLQ